MSEEPTIGLLPWKNPGFIVISIIGVAEGFLAPLLSSSQADDVSSNINATLVEYPYWMVIGGLCLTAFSSLSMYILLRQMTVFPPFFRWFFRLGVWSFPAIAVGIVLAMLSRVLGIYEPQPYAFLIVEAFGLLCTGLVGLKTMHTLAEFQDPMRSQNALSMWRHRDDSHDLRP